MHQKHLKMNIATLNWNVAGVTHFFITITVSECAYYYSFSFTFYYLRFCDILH